MRTIRNNPHWLKIALPVAFVLTAFRPVAGQVQQGYFPNATPTKVCNPGAKAYCVLNSDCCGGFCGGSIYDPQFEGGCVPAYNPPRVQPSCGCPFGWAMGYDGQCHDCSQGFVAGCIPPGMGCDRCTCWFDFCNPQTGNARSANQVCNCPNNGLGHPSLWRQSFSIPSCSCASVGQVNCPSSPTRCYTQNPHGGRCGGNCDCTSGFCSIDPVEPWYGTCCASGEMNKAGACVPAGSAPKGFLDGVSCGPSGTFSGWACDPDDYNAPLTINFFEGATQIATGVADGFREQAVGDQCGGNRSHGYVVSAPVSIKNGASHIIHARAVGVGLGGDSELSNSPLTTPVCPVPPCDPTPVFSLANSKATPSSVAVNSPYTVTCDYGITPNPNCISADCNGGTPGPGTFTHVGPLYTFPCTSGSTPGTFPNTCALGTCNNYCPQSNPAGTISVGLPVIQLGTPNPADFPAANVGDPTQTLLLPISNIGPNNSSLKWQVVLDATAPWLKTLPAAGAVGLTNASPPDTITVQASIGAPGTSTGTLKFKDAVYPGVAVKTATFHLTVNPPKPVILLSAATASFAATAQGRASPVTPITITVTNNGPGSTLNWKAVATTPPVGGWAVNPVPVTPPLQNLDYLASQNFTVTASGTSLLAGPANPTATFTFSDPSGSNTPTLTVTMPVLAPPCGGTFADNRMCGMVRDPSNNDLPNVVLELRDSNGVVQQTQTTGVTVPGVAPAPSHNYNFINVGPGKHFVSPVAGRNQVAVPANRTDTAPQDRLDFTLSGSAAKITVTDAPQTFVLITTAPYSAPNPPTVGLVGGVASYSAMIGVNGQASLNVPSNSSYFITCWKANSPTKSGTVNGAANPPLQPPTAALPSYALVCPAK